jgi:multiple sugar transport system permease protein
MITLKGRIGRPVICVLILLATVTALFPFIYMLLTSLKQTYSMDLNFSLNHTNLNNYKIIFKNFDFSRYFINSTIVVLFACLLNAIISSMAAYGFEKRKFKGSEFLFWVYLATLMVPSQVIIIPMFIIIQKLNMMNTYIALIFPVINAFGVFLIKQFMVNVPDELLEAARIDGCKEFRIFYTIVLPLVRPVLVSLTVFTFITTWNDFVWPLIAITDSSMSTLTLALSSLQGNYATNYGLVMAGATLTFLPPFLLYIFLQKEFVEGIALSGVKG